MSPLNTPTANQGFKFDYYLFFVKAYKVSFHLGCSCVPWAVLIKLVFAKPPSVLYDLLFSLQTRLVSLKYNLVLVFPI